MAVVRQQPARAGRWQEFGLMAFAVALVLFGYIQVALNTAGSLPPSLFKDAGLFAAAALVLHLIVRWRVPYADPVILPVVLLLNGIGLTMIYRLDIAEGTNAINRQLMWTGLGMALAVAVLLVIRDHRALRRLTYTSMIAGIVLLLLPMVPGLGRTINGARIWIGIGGTSFQPAEVAKIVLAIFFAGYLVANRDNLALAGPRVLGLHLPRPRDLGPILIAWGVGMVVLVLERDLGTAVLFFGMFVALMYLATERVSWVILGGILGVGGAVAAATIFPHVGARVDVWLNALAPEIYSRSPGGSYQVVQGLFGMSSGGLMGSGFGLGYPQLVPYAGSDFIMASLGEELGLTGLLAILLLYLILVQRGLRAAVATRDGFGKLLGAGLAFTMALQVFVVVGGVTRLIPLTGLTTPFLALGGSSLIANWMIVALLLRISDSGRRPAPVASPSAVLALAGSTASSPDDAAPLPGERSPGPVAGLGDEGWDPEQPGPGEPAGDDLATDVVPAVDDGTDGDQAYDDQAYDDGRDAGQAGAAGASPGSPDDRAGTDRDVAGPSDVGAHPGEADTAENAAAGHEATGNEEAAERPRSPFRPIGRDERPSLAAARDAERASRDQASRDQTPRDQESHDQPQPDDRRAAETWHGNEEDER
ncbi:Cell division protein FtsW [Actinomycetales bacterium JB111]|nr:Cell division protein FtsW [Actinomycetales bacterium JB111]